MARIPVREAVFETIAEALRTDLADVPVERNRLSALSDAAEAPRLVLRDGGNTPDASDGAGGELLTHFAFLEGFVAAPEAELGAALSALYARAVVALCGEDDDAGKVLTGPGGIQFAVTEGGMEPDFVGVTDSDTPIAAFYLDLSVQLRVAVGQRFLTTP